MNQREIKFRAWGEASKRMIYPTLAEGMTSAEILANCPLVMQYTGLKDKNGKEIYEGDVVRVKHGIGDSEDAKAGRYVDAGYRVFITPFEGIELRFLKSLGDQDDPRNQYPIHQTLNTRYRTLGFDYRTPHYDRIAVEETWGENHVYHNRWRQNHFSSDCEVIGNIYENPELLKA